MMLTGVYAMAKGLYENWLTEEGLLLLEAWARDGLTDEQIAHNCGVTARTLYSWKTRFLPIFQALKGGKAVVDVQVENALLKRALGYSYCEVTYERVMVSSNNGEPAYEMQETKRVTREVVGDVTAQIYWLKNRKRDTWKNDHDKAEEGRIRLELDRMLTEAQVAKLNRTAQNDQAGEIAVVFDDAILQEGWAE